MYIMHYDYILGALGKAANDPAYRNALMADPNATLKADGADIGDSITSFEWVNSTNCMNVHIANGGSDWSGAILIKSEK
jgi:hypothetical protein